MFSVVIYAKKPPVCFSFVFILMTAFKFETFFSYIASVSVIQMTGDDSWVLVAIENIKQMCLVTVEFDVTFWTEGTDGFPVLPPVVNLMCPNDCTGNGTCFKGKVYRFFVLYSSLRLRGLSLISFRDDDNNDIPLTQNLPIEIYFTL